MSNQPNSDSNEAKPFRLRILDKEVQIACRPDEKDDLARAAAHVEQSMRELRQKNASSSIEKLAIVTAINTANAWLNSDGSSDESIAKNKPGSKTASSATTGSDSLNDQALVDQMASMNEKLDALLEEN